MENEAAALTTCAYDPANQLSWAQSAAGITTYAHDADGNRTQVASPAWQVDFTWDEQSRLTRADTPSETVSMQYDALSRRTAKENAGGTHEFTFDGKKILEERDGAGAVAHEYTSTLDEYGDLLSDYDGAATAAYQFDALGSTAALLNESASVTDRYVYRAFGEIASHTGTADTPFTFVGKQSYQHDSELDLYFATSRHLDPVTGRWLSQDPIRWQAGDENLYRYVRNNPASAVDPSGEQIEWPATLVLTPREQARVERHLSMLMDRASRGKWGSEAEKDFREFVGGYANGDIPDREFEVRRAMLRQMYAWAKPASQLSNASPLEELKSFWQKQHDAERQREAHDIRAQHILQLKQAQATLRRKLERGELERELNNAPSDSARNDIQTRIDRNYRNDESIRPRSMGVVAVGERKVRVRRDASDAEIAKGLGIRDVGTARYYVIQQEYSEGTFEGTGFSYDVEVPVSEEEFFGFTTSERLRLLEAEVAQVAYYDDAIRIWLDRLQVGFDLAGMAPVLGDFLDVINSFLYLLRGKRQAALWTLGAAAGVAGSALALRKLSSAIGRLFKPLDEGIAELRRAGQHEAANALQHKADELRRLFDGEGLRPDTSDAIDTAKLRERAASGTASATEADTAKQIEYHEGTRTAAQRNDLVASGSKLSRQLFNELIFDPDVGRVTSQAISEVETAIAAERAGLLPSITGRGTQGADLVAGEIPLSVKRPFLNVLQNVRSRAKVLASLRDPQMKLLLDARDVADTELKQFLGLAEQLGIPSDRMILPPRHLFPSLGGN